MAGGKVLVHRTMSLDGFIAGTGHALDWVFRYPAPEEAAGVVAATGTILAGRGTYEAGRRRRDTPGGAPYGGSWTGPVLVLTHRLPEDAAADPATTFLAGDIRAAVGTALETAAGKDVAVLGADVAAQCFEHQLVDEVLVHVAPVMLGAGVRFYERTPPTQVELEPVSATRSGPLTTLRFRVRK
jgi:dihydrofolate reductase